jgi:hypothetical protein
MRVSRTLFVLVSAVLLTACDVADRRRHSTSLMQSRDPWVSLRLNEAVPHYDAWMTWRNYDLRQGDPEQAIYIWNDAEVGQGDSGLLTIMSNLSTQEPGSTVLIYPDYNLLIGPGGPQWLPPFNNYSPLMTLVARCRGVTLVNSPRDHEGRLIEVEW